MLIQFPVLMLIQFQGWFADLQYLSVYLYICLSVCLCVCVFHRQCSLDLALIDILKHDIYFIYFWNMATVRL